MALSYFCTPCGAEHEMGESCDYWDAEPINPCSMCRGEGYVGTGYSMSFVDASDAMPCPICDGSGEAPALVAPPRLQREREDTDG